MRAVGFRQPLPISEAGSLLDLDLPRPKPAGRDLLVKVEAVSVNPVDTKVRRGMVPLEGDVHVLGWDAAGTVVEAGPEAARFEAGDAVYYAGELRRPGTNAEFHLVDERLVGRAVAEASGRIIPATAGAVAASGVDLISTGWLAHSAPALAIGLDHRG